MIHEERAEEREKARSDHGPGAPLVRKTHVQRCRCLLRSNGKKRGRGRHKTRKDEVRYIFAKYGSNVSISIEKREDYRRKRSEKGRRQTKGTEDELKRAQE